MSEFNSWKELCNRNEPGKLQGKLLKFRLFAYLLCNRRTPPLVLLLNCHLSPPLITYPITIHIHKVPLFNQFWRGMHSRSRHLSPLVWLSNCADAMVLHVKLSAQPWYLGCPQTYSQGLTKHVMLSCLDCFLGHI